MQSKRLMPISHLIPFVNPNIFRVLLALKATRLLRSLWALRLPRTTRALLAALFGSITLIGSVHAAIPDTERAVLSALFTRTHGDNWINKEGWNGTPPGTECTWHGIACDVGGSHVIEVVLSGNNLLGQLPATINQLSALQKFDLHSNELTGAIPALGGLSSLSFFSVGDNQLRGPIPTLSDQGLGELATFVVAGNRLTGAIASLTGLSKLNAFDASDNQLTGSLPSLDGLSSLTSFKVGNNQLSGTIPAPPSTLIADGSSLCPNQLTVTPDTTWDLATPSATWNVGCIQQRLEQTLSFLEVPVLTAANGLHPSGTVTAIMRPDPASIEPTVFTSLTPEICAATTFAGVGLLTVTPEAVVGDVCTVAADKAADISFNSAAQRRGSITISTELDPADLTVLLAFYNSTFGDRWRQRDHWKDAAFHPCDWFGIFCTADRSHVTAIVMPDNGLIGQLPGTLNQLRELELFQVDGNADLNSPFPPLAGLTKLRSFSARGTLLRGEIPSLTGFSELEEFDVSATRVGGLIPPLTGLTRLKKFHASFSGVSGPIPSLAGLTALEEFVVRSNSLSGHIPAITGLPALRTFDVSNNVLSGSLPEFTDLPAFAFLFVQNNRLTGTLPAIDGLPALQSALFADNELKGPIPAFPTAPGFVAASLCPNQLTVVVSPEWDAVTLTTPWSLFCKGPLIDQTLSFGPPPILTVRGTALAVATVTPLPGSPRRIHYESLTPHSCVVNAVSGEIKAIASAVAGDVCTYTADKLGDGFFNTAPQVEQSIVIQAIGAATFTVTPSTADANGTINPNTALTVVSGNTATFTITPNVGFNIASVGGTCGGALTGNSFTTIAVVADCTVIASFVAVGAVNFTVTPSTVDANGTINPNTAQTVVSGNTATFTITPNAGFNIASVDGTCGGALTGNSFTTNAVTADCTVIASFVAVGATTFTVTPGAVDPNGSINPNTPQTVASGNTATFIITPNAGFFIAGVTGTCGGVLTGNSFTTNAITTDCTVNPSFALIPVASGEVAVPTLSQWALMLLALLAVALAARALGVRRIEFHSH
jgi:Leucine-rich repeat (LRR) protein